MHYGIDGFLAQACRRLALPLLRFSLGVVFVWFGLLKVLGVSPVLNVVTDVFSASPLWFRETIGSADRFFLILGIWEMAIGTGFFLNRFIRITFLLFLIQMAATFGALYLSPSLFFASGSYFHLTVAGEFVVKNLVLLASGITLTGFSIRSRDW